MEEIQLRRFEKWVPGHRFMKTGLWTRMVFIHGPLTRAITGRFSPADR